MPSLSTTRVSSATDLHRARRLARPSRGAFALAAAVLAGGVMVPVSGIAHADTNDDINQVEAQISALQTQSEAATEAYNAGRIKLANAQRDKAAADAAVTRQQQALAGQERNARSLAAAEYRDGGMGKLLTFIGSGDPNAFLEQASTLSSISNTQAAQLQALQSATARLADAKSVDAQKQAAADDSAKQLAAAQAHVQDLLTQQNTILSGLKEKQREELAARQAAEERAAQAAAQAQLQAAQQQAAAAEQAATAPAAPANTTASSTSSSSSSSSDSSSSAATAPIPSSDRASVALSAAYSQIGKPYVYGGSGPNAYDCSGLTMWAFAHAGIALPHSAAGQYGYGTHVSRAQLQPGDLVFFDEGGGIGHVGIYAGNGTMVDAPHTGSTVGVHALYPGFVGGTRL